MGENGFKPWRCKKGHILGQVRRSSAGVRQLLVYREAIDGDGDELGDVDVLGVLDGTMDVRCSVCGATRTWVPGEESLRRVLKRYLKEEVV